ncbi:MAG: CCA tRNA nucleotidyltransferase, partial [Candidatus Thermoplasmatota archaeon]|nr:CCA tRNA nucleotidyltransferase [Candidatus Thermoplasmatota archaeon]
MTQGAVARATGVPDPRERFMEDLEREVARNLTPSPDLTGPLDLGIRDLVSLAKARAKEFEFPLVRALVAGSAGRGTYLPGHFDIDLFVLFPPTVPRENLVEMGLKLGESLLEAPEKRYAEHPYLRGKFHGFTVEVVPGYAVERGDRPLTAVDRTPFHHDYLMKLHSGNSRSEVRLLKRFLRSLGVYGAEVVTEGFSGYLTELLVLRSGSFRGALREAAQWGCPMRLAPPGREPAAEPTAALVMADPADPPRNVAAAVSRKNLAVFVLASREYLTHPSQRFFDPDPPKPPTRAWASLMVARRETTVAALVFPVPGMVPDVVFPQVRRSERSLHQKLGEAGFTVLGSSSAVVDGKAAILVETLEGRLGRVRIHVGPPIGVGDTGSFLAKWSRQEVLS